MIHTTIGVYNNNSYKANGVTSENLEDHIQYNLRMRPGRAFFVDGVCKNPGYLSDERVAEWTQKIKDEKISVKRDSAPYI
jgi:hypothetical protein